MATQQSSSNQHERSAAGLDYDDGDPIRSTAANLGARVVEEGPDVLFNELENLLPESWRDQIKSFPLAAVVLGVGVGLWLGMKKSDEVISAGTALVSSAAMANVSQVMDKINKG
jgi:hypothetical protein